MSIITKTTLFAFSVWLPDGVREVNNDPPEGAIADITSFLVFDLGDNLPLCQSLSKTKEPKLKPWQAKP